MNKKKNSVNDIAKYIIRHPQLTDSQVAASLGVNRTKAWRARQITLHVKFSGKKGDRSVVSWEGFDGIREETVRPGTNKKEYRIAGAAGPLRGKRTRLEPSLFGGASDHDEDIIRHWQPYMHLVVNDERTGVPLSAAQITYRRNTRDRWIPRYFSNPVQSLDYITFEAHARSTIGGPLLRSMVKFIIGRGFRPELELINPGEDSKENQREIDSHSDIVRDLIQVENNLSYDGDGHLDIPFQDKVASLVLNAITFNRSSLVCRYDEPVTIDDRNYGDIASSMQNVHAREMGMIRTNPYTARLEQFQWNNSNGFVDVGDSIYLWNPLVSANTYNSGWYGDSFMLPMIDALRVLRTNIGVNFNAMGENAYSGLGLLSIRPEGSTAAKKEEEYGIVSQRMVPATTNILMKDPAHTRFDNIDYKPEVDSFISMNESLVKYGAATLGMPHAMFYDESASNRATMVGKIQLAIATVINPMRAWISRTVSPQSYDKWFRTMNRNDEELLKKIRVIIKFEDLNIAEWFDKVEAVNEVDSRKQLTDVEYGKLMGLINYSGMVETDAETVPGGSGKNKMSIGSGTEKITMKKGDL
jgi:hypothetical protein